MTKAVDTSRETGGRSLWVLHTDASELRELMIFTKLNARSHGVFTSGHDATSTLSTVTAVDYPSKVDRFALSYELLTYSGSEESTRFSLKISVAEGDLVPSVTDLFPSAGWYERETFDMFGVFFLGNPDLRRILTDYGFRGHPLQKVFPMIGFTEMRYCGFAKRVVTEPVSAAQEYRVFRLAETSWSDLKTNLKMTSLNSFFTPLEQFDNVSGLFGSLFFQSVDALTGMVFDNGDNLSNAALGGVLQSEVSHASMSLSVLIALVLVAKAVIGRANFTNGDSGFYFRWALAVITFLSSGFFFAVWFEPVALTLGGNWTYTNVVSFAAVYLDEIGFLLLIALLLLNADGDEDSDEFDFTMVGENSSETPSGELKSITSVSEDVVAPLLGTNLGTLFQHNAAVYLKVCGLFGFVLFTNLLGMIPYSDTATASLGMTMWVSTAVFGSIIALMIQRNGVSHLFSLFMPSGCPLPLLFLLIPIEFVSYASRVVSLSVRLFANMMAGHTLLKVLIGFSYTFLCLGEVFAIAAALPALAVFVLVFLELAVAGVQAYIFTVLTCLYMKDIYVGH